MLDLVDQERGKDLNVLLGYLGMRITVNGPVTRLRYQHPAAMTERINELNKVLPAENRLPGIYAYNGGSMSAATYIRHIAEGQVPITTGRHRWLPVLTHSRQFADDLLVHYVAHGATPLPERSELRSYLTESGDPVKAADLVEAHWQVASSDSLVAPDVCAMVAEGIARVRDARYGQSGGQGPRLSDADRASERANITSRCAEHLRVVAATILLHSPDTLPAVS